MSRTGWDSAFFDHYRREGYIAASVHPDDGKVRHYSLLDTQRPWRYCRAAVAHQTALAQAVALLDVERAARYQPEGEKTFCNIYAVDLAKVMGVPLPGRCPLSRAQPQLAAADIDRWLAGPGKVLGWTTVGTAQAQAAGQASFVIGYLPPQGVDAAMPGHLVVLLPERRGDMANYVTATFAGRRCSASAQVANDGYRFYAFLGAPMLHERCGPRGELTSRCQFAEWSAADLLQRLPMPAGFEDWWFTRAVLVAEDRRFYRHAGLDPRALARAALQTARGNRQGGSTLTQQLTRRVLGWYEPTWNRKVNEMLVAVNLSRRFPKSCLLWTYLTTAYLGHGTYGVTAAARHHFNQSSAELSIRDACWLASCLKLPWHPSENPQRAERRLHRAAWIEAGLLL